jgi:hypothetical protein
MAVIVSRVRSGSLRGYRALGAFSNGKISSVATAETLFVRRLFHREPRTLQVVINGNFHTDRQYVAEADA